MSKIVYKKWGYEVWFENNEKYCGKVLFVENNVWSSSGNFHYHKIKDETFYIIDGILLLEYELDNVIMAKKLERESVFRIKPGVKHRFTALNKEGCKFIEVSTTHSDDDSYRCYFDDEKNEWVEV